MVTRSTENYELHKKELYEIIKSRVGERKADKFIKFYSERYDSFGRSYIDPKLAFDLIDDYYYCQKIGTRWYAFVGVGGSGKSTLARNVFYFLDNTFNLKRSTTEMSDFIKIISSFQEEDKLKSIYLDEPDDGVIAHSKQGKVLRRIFGKIRQQKLFIGICATDLKDIPPYIFRKLDGIFFCPSIGKYIFFKNKPKKKSYVLQEIRRKYQEKGYKVFFEQAKEKPRPLSGHTIKPTPLDHEEQDYLKNKRADYEKDIKDFLGMENGEKKLSDRDKIIINMKKKGLKDSEIAENVGLSRSRVTQILGNSVNVNC